VALRPRLSASLPFTVAHTMQKLRGQDQAHSAQSSAAKSPATVMSNPLQPLAVGLGRQVQELEKRAAQALRMVDLVRAALPEPEKNHVLSASYRDDTLVIGMDSAMWTAHVRYREQALLRYLTKAGEKPFTVLKVQVGHPGV
jgi:hypothetical protein